MAWHLDDGRTSWKGSKKMNQFLDGFNLLWTGSKNKKKIVKFPKTIIGANINYILSYRTCECKHNGVKPLILSENSNLQELDSRAHNDSSTTIFRTFVTQCQRL